MLTKPSDKVIERESVKMGAILRVYSQQDNWFKIRSDEKWVSKNDLKVD